MKKNVILIIIDGARADRVEKFPNLLGLINKGTFFSNGCTYAPYTIASLHAIFSGVYGNKNGTDSYYGTYKFKKDDYLTIAEYFKHNGFITYGDTINVLVAPKQGFDVLTIHNELIDDLQEKHKSIIDEVEEKAENESKPFFLYLHYSNIHTGIKLNVLDKYDNFSTYYFNNQEQNIKAYDSYFEGADNYIGEIIKHIETKGLLNNSLIFITTDHGISTGEKIGERAYGVFCYEYTAKTFLICIGDDTFPRTEVKELFRTVDLAPTLLDIAGFEPILGYKKFDGVSLLPLLRGLEKTQRVAFIQSGNPGKEKNPPKKPNVHAIKTKGWKLIYNEPDNSYELYHLENDEHEARNLYNSGYYEIQEELMKLLNTHLNKAKNQVNNNNSVDLDDKKRTESGLAELGYWDTGYSKPNHFGLGPTKLAYAAADYLIESKIKAVLELGAGQGRDSLYFSQLGCHVTAIDFSENAIKSIQELVHYYKTNIKPVMYDLTKSLQFHNNTFDCVYSNLTFQFLNKEQIKNLINEVYRVLKYGGLFIASVKNYNDKYYTMGNRIDNDATESRGIVRYFMTQEETRKLIKEFELIKFYEESHINLDKTKSCYWAFIVKKPQN